MGTFLLFFGAVLGLAIVRSVPEFEPTSIRNESTRSGILGSPENPGGLYLEATD